MLPKRVRGNEGNGQKGSLGAWERASAECKSSLTEKDPTLRIVRPVSCFL